MLRSCTNTIILSGKLANIVPAQFQSLRWKRKPRKPFWLGTAKSKIFKIHDQPILPPEEKKELLRLHCNYKTALRSIRTYFESAESKQIDAMDASVQLATPEEIEGSYKANEAWNAECARLREERLTRFDEEHQQLALQVLATRDAKKSLLQDRADELIRIEKEKSKDFVTRENLDAKIEECLNSLTDYTFAIDLEGKRYTGYESEMKPISENQAPPTQPQQNTVNNS